MTRRRLLLAGTVGSALVAAGGWGSGALPPGTAPHGPGAPLLLLGVLLLSFAWWRLRSGLVPACLLWGAPLLLAPPLYSRDVYAYVGQGALVVQGLDPYAGGPGQLDGPLVEGVDDVWRDTPSPYGPLWLGLASVVVRTGSLLPSLVGMRLLAVLGLVLAGWALLRLGGDRALWLGVANPLVLLHLVGGAHNEALMLGLMTAGLAVASVPLAAVLITLAALVKLPALAALPFVVVAAGLRSALVAAPVAAATAAAVSYGTGLGWGWLTTLDAGRARLSLLSVTTGLDQSLPGPWLLLGLAAGAAVAGVLLLRTRSLGVPRALGWALLAVALLLPVVQPWYVLWGLLPLAAAAGPRVAAALGAGCLVLVLLIAPSGRHVVRPPLYGVPVLLAAAAAAATYRSLPRRPARDAPVAAP